MHESSLFISKPGFGTHASVLFFQHQVRLRYGRFPFPALTFKRKKVVWERWKKETTNSSPQAPRKRNNLKVKGLWKKNARDVSYVPSRGFNLSSVFSVEPRLRDHIFHLANHRPCLSSLLWNVGRWLSSSRAQRLRNHQSCFTLELGSVTRINLWAQVPG